MVDSYLTLLITCLVFRIHSFECFSLARSLWLYRPAHIDFGFERQSSLMGRSSCLALLLRVWWFDPICFCRSPGTLLCTKHRRALREEMRLTNNYPLDLCLVLPFGRYLELEVSFMWLVVSAGKGAGIRSHVPGSSRPGGVRCWTPHFAGPMKDTIALLTTSSFESQLRSFILSCWLSEDTQTTNTLRERQDFRSAVGCDRQEFRSAVGCDRQEFRSAMGCNRQDFRLAVGCERQLIRGGRRWDATSNS